MSRRADVVGIGLLKAASNVEKALVAGERLGRGLKDVVRGASNFGGGLARGIGANETAGKAVGVGALATGSYVGAKKVKRKADEIKYRLQYGDQF
jgi:hypothetical protein